MKAPGLCPVCPEKEIIRQPRIFCKGRALEDTAGTQSVGCVPQRTQGKKDAQKIICDRDMKWRPRLKAEWCFT